jgi:hypothetical protein
MLGDVTGIVAARAARHARLVAARARAVVIVVIITAAATVVVATVMIGAVICAVLGQVQQVRHRPVERMSGAIVRAMSAPAATRKKVSGQNPVRQLADSLELSVRHHDRFASIRDSGGGGPGQRNRATRYQNGPFHCAVSLGFARHD